MCGIFGVIASTLPRDQLQQVVTDAGRKLHHRGPDDFRTFVSDDGWCALAFTRLAINDPACGVQPMYAPNNSKIISVTNGEIYNHSALRDQHFKDVTLSSSSDCEVMAPLFAKYGHTLYEHDLKFMYNQLRGVFASLIVDMENGKFVAARDPIGVRPLFKGTASDGSIWFASEAKAILEYCDHIEPFQPGSYYAATRGTEQSSPYVPYYEPLYYTPGWLPNAPVDLQKLHDSFETAVVSRLMSDVPVGVFISGGLDSSLVASIAKKNLPEDYPFHSFSCGLEGSPDIAAAQRVADYLGTQHHVLTFTVQEGIDALESVIYHLETYDITTIRASTPMYLLSELCQKHVKVVLSGEGADEVFGGYLYFHNADSEAEFYDETVRRVKLLYTADVLRGDRSTAAQSLELRVPFLDRDFLDVAMGFSAKDKMTNKGEKIEKLAIRQAFSESVCGEQYLPDEILMRPKEQFSDGVGYNWIDGLKDHCDNIVTEKMMRSAPETFPHDPPTTKEAYFYRGIFEKLFGEHTAVQGLREGVYKWIPKWSESDDPSGRAQKFHTAAYCKTMNGKH